MFNLRGRNARRVCNTGLQRMKAQPLFLATQWGNQRAWLTNSSVGETVSVNANALVADGLIFDLCPCGENTITWNWRIISSSTVLPWRQFASSRILRGQHVFQAGMMLTAGVPTTILGYPHIEMPDMPDVSANAFPVMFDDFSRGYMIVDRTNLAILRDPLLTGIHWAVFVIMLVQEWVVRLFWLQLYASRKSQT